MGGSELTDSSQAKETGRCGGRDGRDVVARPMHSDTLEGAGAAAGPRGQREGRECQGEYSGRQPAGGGPSLEDFGQGSSRPCVTWSYPPFRPPLSLTPFARGSNEKFSSDLCYLIPPRFCSPVSSTCTALNTPLLPGHP